MILLQKRGPFPFAIESILHVKILFMVYHSQEHPQQGGWCQYTVS